jgi:hypothetical protein
MIEDSKSAFVQRGGNRRDQVGREKPIVILSADLLRHMSRIKSPDRQDHPRVLFQSLGQPGVKLYREPTMILGKRVRVAANAAAVDLIEKADEQRKGSS